MLKRAPTIEQIAELMDELDAYRHRIVVIKIGGNSIAEDTHFLTKIAKQVKFLRQNGVRVVLVHGGGTKSMTLCAIRKSRLSKAPMAAASHRRPPCGLFTKS